MPHIWHSEMMFILFFLMGKPFTVNKLSSYSCHHRYLFIFFHIESPRSCWSDALDSFTRIFQFLDHRQIYLSFIFFFFPLHEWNASWWKYKCRRSWKIQIFFTVNGKKKKGGALLDCSLAHSFSSPLRRRLIAFYKCLFFSADKEWLVGSLR